MSQDAGANFAIEIGGREYRMEDLDLNDVVALEEAGLSLDSGSMASIRFVLWRLLLREDPTVTLEQAGAKVTLGTFNTAPEEGPPPIPLHGQDRPNGSSGELDRQLGSPDKTSDPPMSAGTGRP